MPPKKAVKEVAPVVVEEKNFSITISVNVDTSVENVLPNVRVRIFSRWLDCCSLTEVFGSESIPWEAPAGDSVSQFKSASCKFEYEPQIAPEDYQKFNQSPEISIVLISQTELESSGSRQPITFTSLDCSSFLLNGGTISTRTESVRGVYAELCLTAKKSFANLEAVLELQPLVLNIQRLGSYPVLEQTANCYLNNVFLCGLFDYGGVSRRIFCRTKSICQDDSADIDIPACILSGYGDPTKFIEMLSTSSFRLSLFQHELSQRVFVGSVVAEYQRQVATLDLPVAVGKNQKDAKGGGKKASAAIPDIPPPYSPPEPMTDLDSFLFSRICDFLDSFYTKSVHGSASFRLDEMLRTSEDLIAEFRRNRVGKIEGDDSVILEETIRSEIRLCKPSKPDKWSMPADLSLKKVLNQAKEEHLSAKGATTKRVSSSLKPEHERFLECGTHLDIVVQLHRKLSHPKPAIDVLLLTSKPNEGILDAETENYYRRKLKATPYTRMVFVFRYDDDNTLLLINKAISRANLAALPDIQGSLRSYSFTDEERQAACSAELDVVTGFTIIDDDVRIVVIEGLAGPNQGMQSVFMDIPRQKEDDKNLKFLCNPNVLFANRLYAEFGPDLKRIRVRDKLKRLARKPELYNRKQVEEITFEAVDRVMSLRRAIDLKSTKSFDMYPSAESLNTLELLYGEAISIADLDGTAEEAARENRRKKAEAKVAEVSQEVTVERVEQRQARVRPKRCMETDCWNDSFVEHLQTRESKDFLEEQREMKRKAWEAMLVRTQERDRQLTATLLSAFGKDPSKCKVYMYSQQRLNYKVAANNELKKQLAKSKDATFTYNKEFNSQTVSPLIEGAKEGDRQDWLTPSGFLYPKPKSRAELITHPKKPSDARIEDLHEPWDSGSAVLTQDDPALATLERSFCIRFRPEQDFGSLRPPEYEKPFELKLIGDKKKLPRGKQVAGDEKDPAAFRSVHLGGDDALRVMQEAVEKEKAEWKAAVVVDHIDFKVGGYNVRDTPIQLDRTNDILVGEAKTNALKAIRSAKSSTGKDISYHVAPVTLMNQEPYVPNAVSNALLRTKDETKFVTAKLVLTSEGRPADFQTYVNRDEYASKLTRAVAKKKHEPLDNNVSRSGPLWDSVV